ncbi:hypothetical protein PENTCL1PPCAC_24353, partial [Pristionchus entomophagus]
RSRSRSRGSRARIMWGGCRKFLGALWTAYTTTGKDIAGAICGKPCVAIAGAIYAVAIEGFYHGVVEEASKTEPTQFLEGLAAEVDDAMTNFRKFVDNYEMKTAVYWPRAVIDIADKKWESFVPTIRDTQGIKSEMTAFVEDLTQKLDGIYTTDVFAVYVWHSESDQVSFRHSNGGQRSPRTILKDHYDLQQNQGLLRRNGLWSDEDGVTDAYDYR